MHFRIISHYFLIAIIVTNFSFVFNITLRGVTIVNPPFVTLTANGTEYKGFCIDILNEIMSITGLKYELHQSSDGSYGHMLADGRFNGMIGEIQQRKCDFALGDITASDIRSRAADFSDPFINTTLSALISKVNKENMKTFEDLAEQTNISYGILTSGSTHTFLHSSTEPTLRKMYHHIYMNQHLFTRTVKEGINRVRKEKFAFIGESTSLEYVVDKDCNLDIITSLYNPNEIAIALQRGSPYLNDFNSALKQIIHSGKLMQLKAKYWKALCLAENRKNYSNPIGVSHMIFLIISMIMCHL